jgi:spore coat protein CotH
MVIARFSFVWRIALLVAAFGWRADAALAQTQDAFFSDEVLHDIQLTISRRDWQELREHADENTYYAADLRWQGVTVRNIGIRSRGNTTRNGIKPGLRVDINRYIAEQEFLGLRAFALDNAYSDASLLREPLTMKLFARLGLPAPRESHVRLFVNGTFAGVYALVESIDRVFIERTFGAAEAEIERGGYLYEYRWVRPYFFEELGPRLSAYAELFTPKTRETDSMFALFAPLRDLVRAINETPDGLFEATVGRQLDLTAFMKYLAVENFISETDGVAGLWGLHNFYLYRFSQRPLSVLIPWDKDYTFEAPDSPLDARLDTNVLTKRAMSLPDLRRVYYDALAECASVAAEPAGDDPRGWLEREVDRRAAQISQAVAEDPFVPFTFQEFENEVQRLVAYARLRPAFVFRKGEVEP